MPHRSRKFDREPARMEAFTDGVLAVIITIMVLDLKVPAGNSLRDLAAIWPTVDAYLTSFFFVAVYWVNHHHLIRELKRVDFAVLWSNILWMLTLSLVPFFTAYVDAKRMSPVSVRMYAAEMIAVAITFFLLRLSVKRVRCQDNDPPVEAPGQDYKHICAIVLYLSALLLAGRSPLVAMALVVLVAVVYILPDFGLRSEAAD